MRCDVKLCSVSGRVSVRQCSICVSMQIISAKGDKRFLDKLTLTVAHTIRRLCNRQYLTSVNSRHLNYRSGLISARSYILLQKCTILLVSGVDIFTYLY